MSEYGNDRIQEFSLDRLQRPRVVAQFERISRLTGMGIASCGDGTQDYIVALLNNHQVARISGVDGRRVWTVGTKGDGVGQFYYPEGIAVLPNGRIIVADSFNHRLQILDFRTGRFIKQIQ